MSLYRAGELARDQSYMLWQLRQEQLRQILFPLGELSKAQVREYALAIGLDDVAARPDSQDLCFMVPDRQTFWQEQAGGRFGPGELVDDTGRVLGQHKGIVYYTPGQRRGLGLAADTRMYVRHISPEHNRICVGPAEQASCLRLRLEQVNWVSRVASPSALGCLAQLRLHGQLHPATLCPDPDLRAAWLGFETPIVPLAAGQSVVCYGPDGALLLGGVVSATAA